MRRNELIEAMKKQTIGVEIEMNHISRKKAAEVAAAYFGTPGTVRYAAGPYDEWQCLDGAERTWAFKYDSSIYGRLDEKCEMVTPVLRYEDIEALQGLVRELRHAGAISNADEGCGVHVHVGGDGHTPESIRNLVNMMHAHEDQLIKGIRMAYSRLGHYCQKVSPEFLERLNKSKPKTMDQLARCWYDGPIDRNHYSHTRYRMLNLHAFFNRYHTVEFRMFQFDNPDGKRKNGLHAGQLKAMIQFCLAINNLAKVLKNCSPKKQELENIDAYRSWFVRLGLVGDEFKVCRDYLSRGFMTEMAWRDSRRAA